MHGKVTGWAAVALAAAFLAGCSTANTGNFSVFGGSLSKPQVILVGDFEIPPNAVALDGGMAARLKRSMKGASQDAMRAEIGRRVSGVIAETVVANLRAAGIEALPGSRQLAIEGQTTLVVGGRVRAIDEGNRMRRSVIGFGAGKSKVIADVQVTHLSPGESKDVLSFTAEAESASKPGAVARAPIGGAVAVAGAVTGLAAERLSADVEAQARRIGDAVSQRLIGFATEQGWVSKPAA